MVVTGGGGVALCLFYNAGFIIHHLYIVSNVFSYSFVVFALGAWIKLQLVTQVNREQRDRSYKNFGISAVEAKDV